MAFISRFEVGQVVVTNPKRADSGREGCAVPQFCSVIDASEVEVSKGTLCRLCSYGGELTTIMGKG